LANGLEGLSRPNAKLASSWAARRASLGAFLQESVATEVLGRSLKAIADALKDAAVRPAAGGAHWWPSTVRAALNSQRGTYLTRSLAETGGV
jgi:hypothetical protein